MKKTILLLGALLGVASVASASVNVTVNGSSYSIPQKNEKGWGDNVTTWIQAISSNTLQPSGGLFSLSVDADFGATAGLKSLYFKSRSSNIASAGQWRLANTDVIGFRNAANTGDLFLTPGAADGQLNYNGVLLDTISASNTLTNKKLSDSTTSLVNVTDPTKALLFSLGGNTTGTSLTLSPAQSTSQSLSIPNVGSGDALVTNNTTATLTSKSISGATNTLSNIPNSATTAASANTASAIVARDASGNFSAGTITANLTGNVTGNVTGNTSGTAANITGVAAIANGGTGQTTASSAFNALSPMTTAGDVIYGGTSGAGTRLPGPTSSTKQFLTSTGTGTAANAPAWGLLAAGDIPAISLSAAGNGGVTGTLPIANGGTGQTTAINAFNALSPNTTKGDITVYGASGNARLPVGTNGYVLTADSTQAQGVKWAVAGAPTFTAPKVTVYTTGTGTHTLTGSPLYIRVRMVGGGGGGGGSAATASNNGGAGNPGGNTTFGTSLLAANGGSGAVGAGSPNGGSGGTASIAAGATGVAVAGGAGGGGGQSSTASTFFYGGTGGSSAFGGAGLGGYANSAGSAAAANSGSGGGGGGSPSGGESGGGGGSGGYVEATITAPAASYAYVVGGGGGGGVAGTGGFNGNTGGNGFIEVTEFYQ